MRKELKNRINLVTAALKKLAHDEPEVDIFREEFEDAMSDVHTDLDKLWNFQKNSDYVQAAKLSADIAKYLKMMSSDMTDISLLFRQKQKKNS